MPDDKAMRSIVKSTEENEGWFDRGMSDDAQLLTITVEAKSKRGKQLIQRLGNSWWLCRFDENLPCFGGDSGVLISPSGLSWHHSASRWVRATDWLKWADDDLRVSEASLLEHADLMPFVPYGS